MKKFLVVREYTDPDKEQKVIGQFSTKREANEFVRNSVGICWIYKINDKVWEWENKGQAPRG